MEKYLNIKEIASRLGLGRDTLYRWIRAGKFPRGRHFGASHRWALSEIESWEAEQV